MAQETYPKDPDGVAAYTIDWTDFLAELGSAVTISTSVWVSADSALVVEDDSVSADSKKTTVVLSGGSAVLGTIHEVTNTIVPSNDATQSEPRTLLIRMGVNKGGEWVFWE